MNVGRSRKMERELTVLRIKWALWVKEGIKAGIISLE